MASKSKRARMAPQRNYVRTFMSWAIVTFVLKCVIILNIKGGNIDIGSGKLFYFDGIWPGSDAENYIKGFDALNREGLFSTAGILNYWPAGYPLIILLFSVFSQSWTLPLLAVFQSFLFSFAVYFFASQISRTKLRKFSYIVFLLIILNPTLSLSSIVLGYESLTASGFLIASGLMIKDFIEKDDKKFAKYLIINSLIFGLLTFMQPRLIVSGIAINLLWTTLRQGIRLRILIVVLSLFITLFFPTTLIYRNYESTKIMTISTNLGTTMNIGAGDKADGSYMPDEYGVPCTLTGNVAEQDKAKIECVLNWYSNNPAKALKLFYNKTIYFWSPWSGPEASGTMARNPWLNINPLANIASAPNGSELIYGNFGKLISWLWLIGGITLLVYGFIVLWRLGSLEKFIALMAMIVVSTNWLISLVSIGDHRFRVPIMGISLFLQAVGLKAVFGMGKVQVLDGPSLR